MFRVLKSPSAAERIAGAAEFISSFPAATELLIIGASRDAVDDFVRGLACSAEATFGLHRFSLTQFAARLAIGRLAAAGVTPSSAVGAEALAVRAAYEAALRNELLYFAPVTKFPGFARATAATIGDLRAAGVAAEKLDVLEESGPDHAALLGRFHEQMEEVSVADRSTLFQAALEEVRAGASLARNPLLALDVPIHSAIERAFLVELASRRKRGAVHLSRRRPSHARQSKDGSRRSGQRCTSGIRGFESRAAGLLSFLGDNSAAGEA